MFTTLLILAASRALGLITFPGLSWETLGKIWPLPLLYLGNLLFGLGSTKELSLPMLTVLRRLSILMTMVGEYMVFNKKPSTPVQMLFMDVPFSLSWEVATASGAAFEASTGEDGGVVSGGGAHVPFPFSVF